MTMRPRAATPVTASAERAFTLVELLAALGAVVVLLGAATGFMLTALLRENAVLEAERLEAMHDDLAQIMVRAIKTAAAFQIYTDQSQYQPGRLENGVRAGNFLVCLRTDPDGTQIESGFELSGNQIIYTKTVAAGTATIKTYANARIPSGSVNLFNMGLGIVQATWEVETRQDLVPFRVCAMPLVMR
jgi:type II secretory pathway pseudopilin PulG